MKQLFVEGNKELLRVRRMVRLRSPSGLFRIGTPVRLVSGAEPCGMREGNVCIRERSRRERYTLITLSLLLLSNYGIVLLDDARANNKVNPLLGLFLNRTGSGDVQDRTPVTVFQTTPFTNATGVKVNQTITILFSKEIESLPNPALTLSDGINTVNGQGTLSGQTYTFKPDISLAYNTQYTATVKSGWKDKLGNLLASDYVFTFKTEVTPDLSAFTVVSSSPAQSAVSVSPPYTITFNKTPDISTISANSVLITDGTKTYNANFVLNGNTLTIYPYQDFAFATNTTITLKTTVTDIYGVSLSSDYPISFWTANSSNTPFVISRIPSSDMRGHGMSKPISVTFTKDILAVSVTPALFYLTKLGVNVTGAISVSSGTLTFTPSANLAIGTYVMTVKQGIVATDGTSLSADYQFTFDVKNILVSAGAVQTCATLPDGRVRCWGSNQFQTLGDSTVSSISPATSAPDLNLGSYAIDTYAAGINTCALFTDGGYRCWGEGRFGVSGNGNNFPQFDASTATGVLSGLSFTQLAVTELYACGILLGGKTRCWGKNGSGQLGKNNTLDVNDASLSTEINFTGSVGSSVKQLVGGGILFYCALLQNGNVRCWGKGQYGSLGYGNNNDVSNPLTSGNVNLGTTATNICAGQSHVCAVLSTGNVKCWGGNGVTGVLGYVSAQNNNPALAPSMNLGSPSIRVSCGYYHSCAVLNNDQIKCWGSNIGGSLGASSPSIAIPISSAVTTTLSY